MPADGVADGAGADPRITRLVFASEPFAVREALQALFAGRSLRALPADDRGTAEIVLAEALNNVVEHAYAASPGEIELTIHVTPGTLTCTIADRGLPMPDETLPAGALPATFVPPDIPEGGFGWHLIRTLSRDLEYRRVDGCNLLTFRLEAKQSDPAPSTVSTPEKTSQ